MSKEGLQLEEISQGLKFVSRALPPVPFRRPHPGSESESVLHSRPSLACRTKRQRLAF